MSSDATVLCKQSTIASSIHAYENEKHDRYYGKETTIKFALEGNYNRIYLKNGTDITDSGLNEKEVPEAGTVVTEKIYLANVDTSTVDGVETTKYATNPFEISFKYDPNAPQCSEISFGKDNKVADRTCRHYYFWYLQKHRRSKQT